MRTNAIDFALYGLALMMKSQTYPKRFVLTGNIAPKLPILSYYVCLGKISFSSDVPTQEFRARIFGRSKGSGGENKTCYFIPARGQS